MKRIVNFRIFVVVAAGCIISAVVALEALVRSPVWWWIYLAAIFVWAGTELLFFVRAKRAGGEPRTMALVCAAMLLLSAAIITANLNIRINSHKPDFTGRGYLSGVATDDITYSSDSVTVVLEQVAVNGESMRGKARLHISLSSDAQLSIEAGTILSANAEIFGVKPISNFKLNSSDLRSNIRYSASVSQQNIAASVGKASLAVRIRVAVRQVIYQNISPERTAGAAFSLFLGRTDGMDYEVLSALRISGLAHIMSVSGLHISFVSMGILFLLQRLKIGSLATLLITSSVLLFYAFVCGFAPSVTRATLMCSILLLARVLKQRYDLLSSLSLSAVLVLYFSPNMLWDVGFRLSYVALLGIALLYAPLNKVFLRLLRQRQLASAAALTVSVQIGVFPLLTDYFGTFSIYAVLSNLIVIPILTVVFLAMLAALLITIVLPFMGFLLQATSWGLGLVIVIAERVAQMPLAEFVVYSMGLIYVLYYGVLALSGKYLIVKKRTRAIVMSAALALLAVLSVAVNVSKPLDSSTLYVGAVNYNSCVVFTDDQSRVYVASSFSNISSVSDYLRDNKIRKVEAILINGKPSTEAVLVFARRFNVQTIWLPLGLTDDLQLYRMDGVVSVPNTEVFELGGVELLLFVFDQAYRGFALTSQSSTVLMPKSTARSVRQQMAQYIPRCDVLIGQPDDYIGYDTYVNFVNRDIILTSSDDAYQMFANRHFTYVL